MLGRPFWTAVGVVAAIAPLPADGKDIKPAIVSIEGTSCAHDLQPPAHTFESSKGDEIQWTVNVDGGEAGCQKKQKVLLCAYENDPNNPNAAKPLRQAFHPCRSTPTSGLDMGRAFEMSPGGTEQLLCEVKRVTAKKSYNLKLFVGSEVPGNARCPTRQPRRRGRHFLLTHVLDTEVLP